MIQKNPFLKYMIRDEKKDILHSSGYAKVQGGDTIGVASTESYQVRVNINNNRQVVKGYNDSRLVMDAKKNTPRPKAYIPTEDNKKVTTNNGVKRVSSDKDRMSARIKANLAENEKNAVASAQKSVSMVRKPVMPIRPGISLGK